VTTVPSRVTVPNPPADLLAEVRAGLGHPTQKYLPSRLLYDALGSALFDAIGLVPEYGLTRADARILHDHAHAITAAAAKTRVIAELGSGNGTKTFWILDALSGAVPRTYVPIDISAAALARCERELAGIPGVTVAPIEADYLHGLAIAAERRVDHAPMLVLFLGSTIGNFDRPEGERFIADVRAALSPGDALLLGTDLVKPVPELLAAYDDAIGVTAAFNRNLLINANRELGADFDPESFEHRVQWDVDQRRVEMHLVSKAAQTVTITALELEVELQARESIWTESSHKFTLEEPRAIASRTGFVCTGQWVDEEWPFAESLLVAR